MNNFFIGQDLSELWHVIVSSIWFSLVMRIIILLIILRIADVLIRKISLRILYKTKDYEARKQIETLFHLAKNIISY